MKITFDTAACKKHGEDPDVALYLISHIIGHPINIESFEKARKKGYLSFDAPYNAASPMPKYCHPSDTGEFVAEGIMADSKNSFSDARIVNLANKMREIFPAGKKPGYAYTWRDSESCIVDRLKKFFLKYGDYPDEDIIDATKRYVASFNGNYQYMQLLKYFIWKNKTTGEEVVRGRIVGEVEKQSQLAAWLEDTEDKKTTEDWGVSLR